MKEITDDTPIVMLTVGQLRQIFADVVRDLVTKDDSNALTSGEKQPRYVYGIAGIASLFQTSYATAQKLKDGVLKAAVYQHGRKITVDADLAMELFRQNAQAEKK